MKIKAVSLLLLGVVAVSSCTKVESTLEFSDDISVSTLGTVDTLNVSPNDTVWFQFLVSTSAGAIKNVDLEVDETVVKKLPTYSKFAAYNQEYELTINESGNLSRDISTVIIEYPVQIRETPAVMNRSFKATLKATNQVGKVGTNFAYFKGSNTKIWRKTVKLQDGTIADKEKKIFFDPTACQGHSVTEFILPTDEGTDGEETGEEETGKKEINEDDIARAEKVRNSISLVVSFKNIYGDIESTLKTYKMYSPDDEDCDFYLKTSSKDFDQYDRTLMNHTVFFRINDVPDDEDLAGQIDKETDNNKKTQLINQRRDNDYAYFDEFIDEEFLRELDFSDAVTSLLVKGGLYAFQLHDGRRGVIHLNYPNCFNNVSPVSVSRCIVQFLNMNEAE